MTAPPKLPLLFFRWFCHPKLLKYIEGDLIELYDERVKAFGKRKADRKFIIDVLLLFRPGIIRPTEGYKKLNQYDMFSNYFKVGIRNILKYKTFSFINIFGLAVAMSVCMLIMLMLADQDRYDQFHEKKDRIYRILSDQEGSRQPYATSPYPLAHALKADYPIIEQATNLTPGVGGDVSYQKNVTEMCGYFAEPSFFSIFSFELEEGDKLSALSSPFSMVISREVATKLFGNETAVGKVVDFSDRQLPFPVDFDGVSSAASPWGSFTITGVIDESKYVSHLTFDVLVSSSTRESFVADKKTDDLSNNWEWYFRSYTFVLLDEDKNTADLSAALNDLVIRKYANLKSDLTKGFKLQPQALEDVALGLTGNDTNNRMPLIGYYFLWALALVIMLSACLNYTNLSIARALTRAKEIGVRKVTGAFRKNLIFQFLSESVITAMISLAMAFVLLLLLVPAFKGLWVNQYLNFELPMVPSVYLMFIGFALAIGVVAGLYPALYLSKYQPIKVLKNLHAVAPGKLGMRKVLGISQFVISLFFITTSILIYNQFKHFLAFDYGFNTSNVVNIELQGIDHQKLANELQSIPGVVSISACDVIPAGGRSNGNEMRKLGSKDEYFGNDLLFADEHFMNNLGIKFLAGRNVLAEEPAQNIVVNEAMVKKLGFKLPSEVIGEMVETKWGTEQFKIVGVVKDFRYRMLINDDEIKPLMVQNRPNNFEYLNVKLSSTDLMQTMANLERQWKKIDPAHPFKYEFFDEQLQATHHGIFDVVSILGFISILAIIIACLGLLGMATYTAERKTKEVGIRKILGAKDWSIAFLLSKGFLKMLLISIGIGAPLSYFVSNLWLQEFPNRVEFGWTTVLIGTCVLLVLGLLTIGSQTLRASKSNPVDSLKMD
ncbi:MAG TPA: ABC transporter permease [Chryseolinea sp.]|nr:ABC transporter permease [Chryseolinea sp.]